ncbi:MAG TPA: hypothetical protein EYP85_01730, partial [Armatimonadetes bacterium]|nr:hypothetical protein [Armatimonadota bacterium]
MGRYTLHWACFLVSIGLLRVTAAPAYDPAEIMPRQEIEAGMRGTAKTVFKGTRIEEFHIEVLGILEKVDLGGDLILIRILDGPIVERGTNILAGMSGSPVYINGRLIGAMAYAWSFAKEPIAGVTPIEDMLKVLAAMEEPVSEEVPPSPAATAQRLEPPLYLAGERFDRLLLSRRPLPPDYCPEPHTLTLTPVERMLIVSGFSERRLKSLADLFAPYGLVPVRGPGGVLSDEAAELVPGAAVGVQLMRGDMTAGSFGTVTYRKGDQILAFGHSFMQRGRVALPLTTAYVVDVLPSLSRSLKFAAALKSVGTLRQDGYWGIAGLLGESPRLVPVTIAIKDLDRHSSRTVRVEVVQDQDLTPSLVLAAVSEAVAITFGSRPDTMATTVTEVKPVGLPPLRREDVFYGRGFLDLEAVADLREMVNLVTANPFDPTDIEKVNFEIAIQRGRRTARLGQVAVKNDVVKPGDELELVVELKPFEAKAETLNLTLKIPENTPPGNARLGVAGGLYDQRLRKPLGLPQPVAENLAQLVANFNDSKRSDELVVRLALPTTNLTIAGERLPFLPPTISRIMTGAKSSSVQQGRDEVSLVVKTKWVIQGQQVLSITIVEDDRDKARRPAPGKPSEGSKSTIRMSTGVPGLPDRLSEPTSAVRQRARPAAEEKAQEEGEGKKKAEPGKGKPPAELNGREAKTWVETKAEDFNQGQGENVSWTMDGEIRLTAAQKRLFVDQEPFFWAVTVDRAGNLYFASGHEGKVYRHTPEGETTVLFDAEEPEILCLTVDAQGNLYAGAAPTGRIYKITPEGRSLIFYDTPETYVWALVRDDAGHLYAGTGSEARLYRINLADGLGEVIYRCPEAHILSLAVDAGGNVYLGTSNRGKVYRVSPTGQTTALFDSGETAIPALAVGAQGNLYAGTSPHGKVFQLTSGGATRLLYDTPADHVLSLVLAEEGLYASTGSGGGIYRLHLREDTASLIFHPEVSQVLDMCFGAPGTLYAVTGNPAEVYRLTLPYAPHGVFNSQVLDAQGVARWGRLHWNALVPEGTELYLQTRSGNTQRPDASWSEWSPPLILSGARILSPPARFLQYRVVMSTTMPERTPCLRDVTIAYVRQNEPPQLTVKVPAGSVVWSKKQNIKWSAKDENGDALTITIEFSPDGGQTWETLAEGLHQKSSYEWDTTKVEDGEYLLRLTADDSLYNPDDPQRTVKVTDRVIVDNHPPRVVIVGEVRVE